MARLICPHCSNEIKQFDIQKATIPCPTCHKVVPLATSMIADHPNQHKENTSFEGITLEENDHQLSILLRWKDFSHWKFSLIFGLVIFLFMTGLIFLINELSFALIIILIFLFVGLFLAITGLLLLLNRTSIQIVDNQFSIKHRFSMFLLRNYTNIPTTDIHQIFVKRKDAGSSGETPLYNHEVHLKKKSGATLLLVNQIKKASNAYAIEKSIEQFLDIEDTILFEEFRPNQISDFSTKETQIEAAITLAEIRQEADQPFLQPVEHADIEKIFKIDCPKCQSPITPKDVNISTQIVFCAQCQETFSMVEATTILQDTSHKTFDTPPQDIKIHSSPNVLSISWKNNATGAFLLPIFIAIPVFHFFDWNLDQNAKVFITVLLIGFLYPAVRMFLKRTTIRVSNLYLWVDTFPTYLFGTQSKNYHVDDIQQLFVKRKVIKTEDSSHTIYQLILIDKQDQQTILINHQRHPQNLLFVEQKIEAFLNIKDQPIIGEYSPSIQTTPQNISEFFAFAKKNWEKHKNRSQEKS